MKDSSSELSKSDKGKAISETGYDFIKAAQFIGMHKEMLSEELRARCFGLVMQVKNKDFSEVLFNVELIEKEENITPTLKEQFENQWKLLLGADKKECEMNLVNILDNRFPSWNKDTSNSTNLSWTNKSGYFYKMRKVLHTWKKRYMVVKENIIMLYDKEDSEKPRHMYEVISLEEVTELTFKSKIYFKITFTDIKQRSVALKIGYKEKDVAESWFSFFTQIFCKLQQSPCSAIFGRKSDSEATKRPKSNTEDTVSLSTSTTKFKDRISHHSPYRELKQSKTEMSISQPINTIPKSVIVISESPFPEAKKKAASSGLNNRNTSIDDENFRYTFKEKEEKKEGIKPKLVKNIVSIQKTPKTIRLEKSEKKGRDEQLKLLEMDVERKKILTTKISEIPNIISRRMLDTRVFQENLLRGADQLLNKNLELIYNKQDMLIFLDNDPPSYLPNHIILYATSRLNHHIASIEKILLETSNIRKLVTKIQDFQILLKLSGVNSELYRYKKFEPLLNTQYDCQLFRTFIPCENTNKYQEFTMFEKSTVLKEFPTPKNPLEIYSFYLKVMEISANVSQIDTYFIVQYPGMWKKQENKVDAGMKYMKNYLLGLNTVLNLNKTYNFSITERLSVAPAKKHLPTLSIPDDENSETEIIEEEEESKELSVCDSQDDTSRVLFEGISPTMSPSNAKGINEFIVDDGEKEKVENLSSEETGVALNNTPGKKIAKWKLKQEGKFEYYTEIDYYIHPKVGIVLKNKKIISRHRRAGTHLMKKMGTNMLKGCSIMNVSLPVAIFQPRSVLQVLADDYTLSPYYLGKAAITRDPLQRIKYLVGFMVSYLHRTIKQEKPFNPVLGETFQGTIADYNIYLEQISHHPPISAVQLIAHHFKLYGSFEFWAKTSPNSVRSGKTGQINFIINDQENTHITFNYPNVFVGGLMLGRRTINYTDTVTITDLNNELYAQIRFDPYHSGFIKGLFTKMKHFPSYFMGFITRNKELLSNKKLPEIMKSSEIISNIEGSWIEYLEIDKERIWELGRYESYEIKTVEHSLDSDASLRNDIIQLDLGNDTMAQSKKEEIEVLQRHDKKLREMSLKERKKNESQAK